MHTSDKETEFQNYSEIKDNIVTTAKPMQQSKPIQILLFKTAPIIKEKSKTVVHMVKPWFRHIRK